VRGLSPLCFCLYDSAQIHHATLRIHIDTRKFERQSLVNFACTAVEIDALLIVWLAVVPVVDWQPVRATRKVSKEHDMTPTTLDSENIRPPDEYHFDLFYMCGKLAELGDYPVIGGEIVDLRLLG
jgi:hypothetical protein